MRHNVLYFDDSNHRNLGDLDLIIDSDKKDVLYTMLKDLGYKRAGGIFNFARKYLSLEQLEHTKLLGVGYFYGIWKDDGTFTIGDKNLSLSVDSYALEETKYSFCNVNFLGIPKGAIATGIFESRTNPKRRQELLILKQKKIEPLPNKYIHVRIFGIIADWIYHLFMSALNVIGSIRVKLGLPFDPWRWNGLCYNKNNMKINTNLTAIFTKYKGLWVALDETLKKVISYDKNADKVYKEALKKGYSKPTLFKVPQENLPYFGFIK